MVGTGTLHLLHPEPFIAIVPSFFPHPFHLVIISGVAEIMGGVGLLIPFVQVAAAWGLVALFIAVFPANINMVVNHLPFGNLHSPFLAWIRLPFQAVLVAWAYWYT